MRSFPDPRGRMVWLVDIPGEQIYAVARRLASISRIAIMFYRTKTRVVTVGIVCPFDHDDI